MEKIEEIKKQLCEKSFIPAKNKQGEQMTQLVGQNPNGWGKHSKSFNKGFDAAMELQLPVKFAEFIHTNRYTTTYKNGKYVYVIAWDNYKEFTPIELYDYWLTNIYLPENNKSHV